MDSSEYHNLAIGILYDAVRDFLYGGPEEHGAACEFLKSPWGRFLLLTANIDVDSAFQSLNEGRREFVDLAKRKVLGDETAQEDFEDWFRERFRYRAPTL